MKTYYIGTNEYRVRSFTSPLGYRKFLLDMFIDVERGYINIFEANLDKDITDNAEMNFAREQIERIEDLD